MKSKKPDQMTMADIQSLLESLKQYNQSNIELKLQNEELMQLVKRQEQIIKSQDHALVALNKELAVELAAASNRDVADQIASEVYVQLHGKYIKRKEKSQPRDKKICDAYEELLKTHSRSEAIALIQAMFHLERSQAYKITKRVRDARRKT